MSNLLEQHIAHFDYVQSPRLLHMDIWSQNILIDSAGHVTGLVDLDRAKRRDPEIEFAVLDYCGIRDFQVINYSAKIINRHFQDNNNHYQGVKGGC